MRTFLTALITIVAVVGVLCAVIGIASLINDISFVDQIVQWLGHSCPEIVEGAEEATEAVTAFMA